MKSIFIDYKSRLRSGYQILIAFVILLFTTIVSEVVAYFFPTGPISIVIKAFLYGGLSLLLAYLTFRYAYKNQMQQDMDCFAIKTKGISKLLLGFLFGIICFTLIVLILHFSGQYRITYEGTSLLPVGLNLILFISVGISEEVITRGLMQHALLRFGKWPALLIISILFGLLHLGNPGVTINAILGVVFAGLLLGMSMYVTNSIMFPIGFHISWNWIQGSIYGIPVSGTVTESHLFKTTFIGTNSFWTGGDFGTEASFVSNIVLLIVTVSLYIYGKKKNRFSLYDNTVEGN